MALTYGFYDSLNGDRKYNAKQWSSIFDGVINNGVFENIFDASHTPFQCTASGMVITVHKGRAWFDHTWFLSDGDVNNPITFSWAAGTDFAPEPASTRIDAIVLQTNSDPSVRANSVTRIKGTPGGSKPSMTHTTYINQYPLAYVTVGPAVTSLTNSNIENAVGTTDTPYVTGILETLDSTALYAQWASDYALWKSGNSADYQSWRTTQQTAFNTWFQGLEDYLTPSAEATLTSHVVNLERTLTGTFLAASWVQAAGGGTWSQTINVTGINATDNPILIKQFSGGSLSVVLNSYTGSTSEEVGNSYITGLAISNVSSAYAAGITATGSYTLKIWYDDDSESETYETYAYSITDEGGTVVASADDLEDEAAIKTSLGTKGFTYTSRTYDSNNESYAYMTITVVTAAQAQKAYNKAFGILAEGYGTTAADSVTMTVYKLPVTNITVGFKGV